MGAGAFDAALATYLRERFAASAQPEASQARFDEQATVKIEGT